MFQIKNIHLRLQNNQSFKIYKDVKLNYAIYHFKSIYCSTLLRQNFMLEKGT